MTISCSASVQRLLAENNILFIVGPTGVGKSALAIEAARYCGGEIVSCDAMQVYREVNIASDKPLPAMRALVPHHLLDVVSVEDDFNVARYRVLALAAIEDIFQRGRKVIVCGGSGMYMMALLDGLFDSVEIPAGIREALMAQINAEGSVVLHQRLQQVDSVSAGKINPNDAQRIIRALEIFESTGMPISALQPERNGLWGKYSIGIIGLFRSRQELYSRAEVRIERMFELGLVEEVNLLNVRPLSATASRLIGIREVNGFINGEYPQERAKELMKLNTRHYIKRQLTWFRKDQRIEWVEL